MKRRGRRVVVLAAVVIVAVAACWIGFSGKRTPGYATGDATNLSLVGVYLQDLGCMWDASGRNVRRDPGLDYMQASDAVPRVEFVFDVPESVRDIAVSSDTGITPTPKKIRVPNVPYDVYPILKERPYGNRIYAGCNQPPQNTLYLPSDRNGLRWMSFRLPRRPVDFKLVYWRGPRGEAEYTFLGPFKPGQPVAAQGDKDASVSVEPLADFADGMGAWCCLRTRTPITEHELLAYDRAGKRHVIENDAAGAPGKTGTEYRLRMWEILPEDLSAITIGEKPRERVYHNVRVAPSGGWRGAAPDYCAEIGRRIGTEGFKRETWETLVMRHGLTPQEALKIADIVTGSDITQVADKLLGDPGTDFAHLAPQDRERLCVAAERWLTSHSDWFRASGLALGLRCDYQRFRKFVFIELRWHSYGGSRVRISETLLTLAGELTVEDFREIRTVLIEGPYWRHDPILVACLAKCGLPAAGDALAEIARDGRTPMWWRALREEKTLLALGPEDGWSKELKLRFLLSHQPQTADKAWERAIQEEAAGIPPLLTMDLADADIDAFREVLRTMVKYCQKDETLTALVDFVEQAAARSMPMSRGVGDAVVAINKLAGTDFGELGSDTDGSTAQPYLVNWREVSEDIHAWHAAGALPPSLPEDYRARPGDLRVIVLDTKDPEAAVIDLWAPGATGEGKACKHYAGMGSVHLGYSMTPVDDNMARNPAANGMGPAGYYLRAIIRTDDGSIHRYGGAVSLSKRPEAISHSPIEIEEADSLQSVLSGTKVYEEWWRKHGTAPEVPRAGEQVNGRAGDKVSR